MKKLRKRDKYVIAAVLNLCWYCIAVLVLTAHDKVVPDSLTVAWGILSKLPQSQLTRIGKDSIDKYYGTKMDEMWKGSRSTK